MRPEGSITNITLDASSSKADVVQFNGPGRVRVVLSDATPADVVITNATSAQVTVTGGVLPSVRIDRVKRLDLQIVGCRIEGSLFIYTAGTDAEPSTILVEDVVISGEFRLEDATLAGLQIAHCIFREKAWIRKLKLPEPNFVALSSCTFEDRVYITGGFEVVGASGRDPREPLVDLRQNDFHSISRFDGLDLQVQTPDEMAISFRGSTFANLARIAVRFRDGIVDARNIAANGAAQISIGGANKTMLRLDGSEFHGPVMFTLTSVALEAPSVHFWGGGQIESDGDINFADSSFGQTTIVRPLETRRKQPPCLIDIRRADVQAVTLLDVDLRKCRFSGAVGLDSLTIETATQLWPARGRRRTILDEHDAREPVHIVSQGETGSSGTLNPSPDLVASCYRQLRKGRESAKDEPGAADFYYGEMEMRRLSAARSRSLDYPLLAAYWATSGYGLRAWRAFLSLLIIVTIGGLCLGIWGIHRHTDSGSIWFGILSATEVATLRSSSEQLTTLGRILSIPLRLLAPLMFVLLILALRSRIHR